MDHGRHDDYAAADDPGFGPSMGSGSPLGRLRLLALVFCGPPLALTLVVLALVPPADGLDPIALLLPGVGLFSVAMAALLPVPTIAADTPPEEAAAVSAQRVQSAIIVRLALTETPVLLGFAASFAFDSGAVPVLTGLLITAVALPLLALPTRAVLHRIQDRLEAQGATSRMWQGLNTIRS